MAVVIPERKRTWDDWAQAKESRCPMIAFHLQLPHSVVCLHRSCWMGILKEMGAYDIEPRI